MDVLRHIIIALLVLVCFIPFIESIKGDDEDDNKPIWVKKMVKSLPTFMKMKTGLPTFMKKFGEFTDEKMRFGQKKWAFARF